MATAAAAMASPSLQPPSASPPAVAILPPSSSSSSSPSPMTSSAKGAATAGHASYLKGYPYLFVRETDQLDYFCTLCESYLKELELQSHLFEGHRAENVEDNFVRVKNNKNNSSTAGSELHICVVCWAKIPGSNEELLRQHRLTCQTSSDSNGSADSGDAADDRDSDIAEVTPIPPSSKTNVIATPDVANLLSNSASNSPSSTPLLDPAALVGANSSLSLTPLGPRGKNRGNNILKRGSLNNGVSATPALTPFQLASGGGLLAAAAVQQQQQQQQQQSVLAGLAAHRLQCTLCSMVVPLPGYLGHLRDFHRVTSPLDDLTCPLCLSSVPVLELSFHLTAMHALVPTAAANSIMLWVLTSGTLTTSATPDANKTPTNKTNTNGPLLPNGVGGGLTMATNLFQSKPVITPSVQNSINPSTLFNNNNNNSELSAPKLNSLLTSPLTAFKDPTANPMPNLFGNAGVVPPGLFGGAGAPANIPTVLQGLLSKQQDQLAQQPRQPSPLLRQPQQQQQQQQQSTPVPAVAAVGNIVSKFTRCHVGDNGKESIQCLVCSKWFAVPPVKHLRGHMVQFKEDKKRLVALISGSQVCIICYEVFDDINSANTHLITKHDIPLDQMFPNAITSSVASSIAGSISLPTIPQHFMASNPGIVTSTPNADDIPTVIDLQPNSNPIPTKKSKKESSNIRPVELDNAGRVKSGKVRKQCELCGEWSNIKWFFKHMSECHQALFCRCCREYLPIHEHEEHKRWHAEPPYMGQKIRIEEGRPVIIDRKERASLTPIGSLAAWGGSSGGKVVKAADISGDVLVPVTPSPKANRKRKANNGNAVTSAGMDGSPTMVGKNSVIGHIDYGGGGVSPPKMTSNTDASSSSPSTGVVVKDTLMPKETCPVCGIQITYKNLARHIKLRHKIKYKFCHRCRKLIPSPEFEHHRATCSEIVIDGMLATTSDMLSGNDDDSKDDEAILDPSDFLETGSNLEEEEDGGNGNNEEEEDNIVAEVEEEDDDEEGELVIGEEEEEDQRQDTFRTNTSKNKLESLLGKEFKHPRRKCSICGYTVSYSNFKRHVRNAHPEKYDEHREMSDNGIADTLSSEVTDGDEVNGSLVGHIVDEDEEEEMEEEEDKENSKTDSDDKARSNSEGEQSSIESKLSEGDKRPISDAILDE